MGHPNINSFNAGRQSNGWHVGAVNRRSYIKGPIVRVSFGELRIGDIARGYLQSAIEKNWASEGENVKEFERRFANRFDYKHAVAMSSGTDAVIVSCATLHDLGASRGDEIITPACGFVATANAILAAGFTPKFVDVELDSLNIDPNKIEAAITPRTRRHRGRAHYGKALRDGPHSRNR